LLKKKHHIFEGSQTLMGGGVKILYGEGLKLFKKRYMIFERSQTSYGERGLKLLKKTSYDI